MSAHFLIVSTKILPDYLEKVIKARNMLESQEVTTVTEAVTRAGISRNTYYKYKDHVFAYESNKEVRRAVISFILRDEKGVLSNVLSALSEQGLSVLTISQAIPVNQKANVLVSLDVSKLTRSMDEVLRDLKTIKGVKTIHLDAME